MFLSHIQPSIQSISLKTPNTLKTLALKENADKLQVLDTKSESKVPYKPTLKERDKQTDPKPLRQKPRGYKRDRTEQNRTIEFVQLNGQGGNQLTLNLSN